MAQKRKKVPPDPPAVIAVRERMRPLDFTKVGRTAEFDRQWHLCWIHEKKLDLARQRGYLPVSPGEVEAPAAWGDKTKKNQIKHVDVVLCKCSRETYDKRKAEEAEYARYQLEGRAATLREQAEAGGIKLEQSLEIGKPLKGEDAERFVRLAE